MQNSSTRERKYKRPAVKIPLRAAAKRLAGAVLSLPVSAAIASWALLCSGAALFAQSVQAPQPPEVPTVSVPTVSAPALNAPALNTPALSVPAPGTPLPDYGAQNAAKNQPHSPPRQTAQSSSVAQRPSATAAAGKLASLSAAEISMLSNLFGSGNPLSLNALGGNTAAANAASLSASQGETAALLQAVLEKLDTLQKTVEQKSAEPASSRDAANGGKILRFISGSYNILAGCTAVFISKPEADGSFLLTGDRTYRTGGGTYGETFYMLFKSRADGMFNVAVSVNQHTENPQSVLKILEASPVLTAAKTGNLVTMRTQTPNGTIDLLLDIDFEPQRKSR